MISSFQQRLEDSTVGRVLISCFIAFLLFALFIWNMPASEIQRVSVPIVRPFIFSTGLDQVWSVFAPDPRFDTFSLTARIEYADGTTEMWEVPRRGEPLISPYRYYHWQKWSENVRLDAQESLWQPAAAWIARTNQDNGRPVRVTLIRNWVDTPAPGSGPPPDPKWNRYEYFTLEVTAEILEGGS